jgi:hypothetical protein
MKDPDFTPKKQWMLSSARFFMPHCGNFRATGNLTADNHLIFQLIYYSRWGIYTSCIFKKYGYKVSTQ